MPLYSYKEDSEEETDSDDIIEQDDAAAAEPEEDVETIEKIVRHRKGRKGGKEYTFKNLSVMLMLTLYMKSS